MPIFTKILLCLLALSATQVSYGDNLSDIYELALSNDAHLRAARAQFKADAEVEIQSRSQLLPQVGVQFSVSNSKTENSGAFAAETNGTKRSEEQTLTLAVDQPLFDLNRWYTFKSGQALSRHAAVKFASNQQELIVRVAEAYFNVLRAQDNLTSSRAEEKAIQRQLEQTQQRFDVGLIAITDVHEARAVYDISLVGRLNDEGLLGISMEALTVITGEMHANLNRLAADFPILSPEPLAPAEWVDKALKNNLDISASAHAMQAALNKAQAAKASHYPSVSAGFQYTDWATKKYVSPFSPEDVDDSVVSLKLKVPLYSGGYTSSKRRQAYEQYNGAKENHTGTMRNTIQATRSLHLAVITDISQVRARKQSITSSQSALDATEAGYEVGTRNVVDVLQAQRTLFAAKRDYANARYNYIVDMLKLKQQAGLLSPDDIYTLNKWLNAE